MNELITRLTELAEWAGGENWTAPLDLSDTIMEAVERLKRMRWVPATDRLPENFQKVLTIGPKKGIQICRYRVNDTGYMGHFWTTRQTWATVTHWMPLPEPPRGDKP